MDQSPTRGNRKRRPDGRTTRRDDEGGGRDGRKVLYRKYVTNETKTKHSKNDAKSEDKNGVERRQRAIVLQRREWNDRMNPGRNGDKDENDNDDEEETTTKTKPTTPMAEEPHDDDDDDDNDDDDQKQFTPLLQQEW